MSVFVFLMSKLGQVEAGGLRIVNYFEVKKTLKNYFRDVTAFGKNVPKIVFKASATMILTLPHGIGFQKALAVRPWVKP